MEGHKVSEGDPHIASLVAEKEGNVSDSRYTVSALCPSHAHISFSVPRPQLTTVVFSEGGDMLACGSAYIVRASPYPTLLDVRDALMGLAGKPAGRFKSTLSNYQVGGQRSDNDAQP